MSCVPKIIKFGGDLTKFWQKQVGSFFGIPCTQWCSHRCNSCSNICDRVTMLNPDVQGWRQNYSS